MGLRARTAQREWEIMVRLLSALLTLGCILVSSTVFGYSSYDTATRVWDLQQQLSPITIDSNLMYVEATGVRLKSTATSGVAGYYGTDAPLATNWAVGSWNVDMPSGTGVRIEIRGVNGGSSTSWFEIARQGTIPSGISRVKGTRTNGIDDDTLVLPSTWPRIEYRVTLYTNTLGVTPTLRLMSLCYANSTTSIPYVEIGATGFSASLDAPWRSQYWEDPNVNNSICGPTSMSMAMAYNGCNLPTATVYTEEEDTYNGIYGNWPFLAQEAAKHGFKSYYMRARANDQVVRDFLGQGTPVEIGMAYSAGELRNSPISSTAGHLVLCVGMTSNGDWICNDPAGSTTFWDHVMYYKEDLANVWYTHAATMIPCIANSVYWRFPYYSYKSTDPISTDKGGIMQVFAKGGDGQIYGMAQAAPNGGWGSWTAMGGTPASDPVAVSNVSGGSTVFARFTDGNLWYKSQAYSGGSWAAWVSLGAVAGRPAAGKSPDGYWDVFCRMADGSIQHRWSRPTGVNAWASLGGNFPGDPVVGLNWEGREEVFVRGSDNQLYHCWQLNDGTFSGWASLGGSIAGEPTIGKLSDGRLEIYCRFIDGSMQHNWQLTQNPGTSWGGWNAYSGTTTTNLVAARTPTFMQELYSAGTGGTINRCYQTSVDGAWSAWESLGGSGLGGAPMVGHNEDGRLQVFQFRNDGKMYSTWQQTSGGWSGWTAFGAALFQETTPPVISSVTSGVPALVAAGDTIVLIVTATDNVGVTEVRADGKLLSYIGSNKWSGSVPASATMGPNHVQVVAKDAAGNTATDNSVSYTTVDVVGISNAGLVAPAATAAAGNYLFRVFGTVSKLSDNLFSIDDGTGTTVQVDCPGHGLNTGQHATVRGIFSAGTLHTSLSYVRAMD